MISFIFYAYMNILMSSFHDFEVFDIHTIQTAFLLKYCLKPQKDSMTSYISMLT